MAIKSRNLLKNTFIDGYIPTGNDFSDVFDSFIHQQDDVLMIDNSGNVGIGTNTPSRKLHVHGDVQVDGTVYSDNLDVSGNVEIGGDLTANSINVPGMAMIPIGGIIMWSGNVAPAGWGLCDGGTYPRADGSGNIVTPNLKGRFIVGYDSGLNDYNNPGDLSPMSLGSGGIIPGKVGGLASVKLTAQESGLRGHPHTSTTSVNVNWGGTHSHQLRAGNGTSGNHFDKGGDGDESWEWYRDSQPDDGGHSHTATASTIISPATDLDANNFHENRPPYYVLAFIMKL